MRRTREREFLICNSDSPERFPAARTRAQDNNSDDSFPIANRSERTTRNFSGHAAGISFFAGWFVAWREKRGGIKRKMFASMNRKWDLSGIGGRE